MNEEKQAAFEEAVKLAMKWLAENCNPHTQIVIEANSAQLYEGQMVFNTNEFLVD